jgi:hypothetical protein
MLFFRIMDIYGNGHLVPGDNFEAMSDTTKETERSKRLAEGAQELERVLGVLGVLESYQQAVAADPTYEDATVYEDTRSTGTYQIRGSDVIYTKADGSSRRRAIALEIEDCTASVAYIRGAQAALDAVKPHRTTARRGTRTLYTHMTMDEILAAAVRL